MIRLKRYKKLCLGIKNLRLLKLSILMREQWLKSTAMIGIKRENIEIFLKKSLKKLVIELKLRLPRLKLLKKMKSGDSVKKKVARNLLVLKNMNMFLLMMFITGLININRRNMAV